MRRTLATACFVIGSIVVPVFAQAADVDADHGDPAAFVKDSVITTKVKAKLAAERLDSLKHIRVETDADGVVWLSGKVESRDEANKAVAIARNTEGVRSVLNDLDVRGDR